MIDQAQLTLFLYILMRMTGFVAMNPLWGRANVPARIKAGMALVLTVFVHSLSLNVVVPVPATAIELSIRLLLELALGYLVGIVMQFFFFVPLMTGHVIDSQMGTTMSESYDPTMGTNISLTGAVLNIAMIMIFFAAGGHITLLRILMNVSEIIPYGAVSIGPDIVQPLLTLFSSCLVLSVKLSLPILAAELIGQLGMGILMKVIPQINVFAINFELKIIVGLVLVALLLPLMSEFILGMEKQMLVAIEQMLKAVAVS